ncbi:hypothetical protein [Crocosphaera sp. Alani8]
MNHRVLSPGNRHCMPSGDHISLGKRD